MKHIKDTTQTQSKVQAQSEAQSKKLLPKKQRGKKIHDAFFKEVYAEPKYSLDLFRLVLSKKEQAVFDWDTLKLEVTTFTNEDLKERRVDLLFSVNLKSSNERVGVLFLLEHKSSKDPKTLIQLLEYQTDIYRKKRMPIIPILFYHGKKKEWKLPLNFHDFLEDFRGKLRRRFKKDVLHFRYRLLNVQKLDINKEAKGLTSQLIFFIFKNIWDLDKAKIKELFSLGYKLGEKERKDLVLKAVNYIQEYYPDFSWKIFVEAEKEAEEAEKEVKGEGRINLIQDKGGIMSLLEQRLERERQKSLQKGLQAGMEKGQQTERQAVILNMLKKKLDVSLISEVTGLSEEEIKKLKNGQ